MQGYDYPTSLYVADSGAPLFDPLEGVSSVIDDVHDGRRQGDGRRLGGETPVHAVALVGLEVDVTIVTNDDFVRFVEATGYRTEAETFEYSAVFHLAFTGNAADVVGVPPRTSWWLGVR